jgi:hypothetical protein
VRLPVLRPADGVPSSADAAVPVRVQAGALRLSLRFPRAWRRVASSDPQVPLLIASPGDADALLVRITSLGLGVHQVTLAQLPTLKPLTDRLIAADRRTRLLGPPVEVDIDRLPGYAYVYTLPSAAASARSAHVHYFLFDGPTVIALVFQVADARRLHAVAPALARIAATLTVSG